MPPKVSNDEPESDRMDVIIHVFIVRNNEGVSAQALLRSACWTLIPVAPEHREHELLNCRFQM